ncbi:MAG TPA: arginine--tRNA ligase [Rhodothermales bacterium]|nr:arginine--tRNA ligase [Rhodothermales bacterium]
MQDLLTRHLRDALAALAPEGFDAGAVEIEYQTPKDPSHGDLATNLAMQLARPLSRAPRQIAEALAAYVNARVADDAALARQVAGVEVAGPGFLNVRLAATGLTDGLRGILEAGAAFGRTDAGGGRTAIVEYVSANPTGPLTVGHGRNAVLGDTFANLLTWTGWEVTREYYFNNAGRQMRILGQSVKARAGELLNPDGPVKTLDLGADESAVVPASFPEDGYVGEYIIEIAREVLETRGAAVLDEGDEVFTAAAEKAIFADIEATMARLSIRMDSYFNEHTLYENNAVWKVMEDLKAKDLAFEKDGATWFRTSVLGKVQADAEGEREVDTVLVKSSGEPTYRLPDIAYHMEKLSRGFSLVLDVFGADHIATYPDVLRGVEALGGDTAKIDVVVYQFVTLVRGGEPFKMSTRKARYVTLDDLMEEVGADVTRFFFLMRSPNTHLEFDLDLAKEASEKNPVFYLQYAHARIASILRKAAETGLTLAPGAEGVDFDLLTHPNETVLIKELLRFPEVVVEAAEGKAPHKVAAYLREAATAFSAFYRDSRILGEDPSLGAARLHLAEAARTVLANGLAVLGISAPDRMDRA